MTVKELIESLKNCSPDAIVCVEVWSNPGAEEIKEYANKNDTRFVYIGDDLENLTCELIEEYGFREVE